MEDEFSLEARIYDTVWGKHDYDSDVKFLDELFRKHDCKRIVDIGCGTGNHAVRLDGLGYEVTGFDVSPTMLEIAKRKDKNAKIKFVRGDMKKLEDTIPKGQRFDAAICLGQVFSHLMTDSDVHGFFKALRKILRKNGLFAFSARNAKRMSEEYLNKLLLNHMINEEKIQLLVLGYNSRDEQDPNILVWRPIYLLKENNKVDLQIREHKLRWFELSMLKKALMDNGFRTIRVYSGPNKEEFSEDKHTDMWFVTTAK
jgi:SAM-dependent methyltransferase